MNNNKTVVAVKNYITNCDACYIGDAHTVYFDFKDIPLKSRKIMLCHRCKHLKEISMLNLDALKPSLERKYFKRCSHLDAPPDTLGCIVDLVTIENNQKERIQAKCLYCSG